MKPRKVRVHGWCSGERPLKPFIVPSGKAGKRETAYLVELMQVVLKGLAAKTVTCLGAKGERGAPTTLVPGRKAVTPQT